MSKKDEALKLALEALERALSDDRPYIVQCKEAITAIREALAEQPAQQQEPVYWQWRRKDQPWSLEYTFNSEVQVTTKDSERRALYTSPPASKPLTDEQIDKLPWGPHEGNPLTFAEGLRDFARAIEAAHGIIGEQK